MIRRIIGCLILVFGLIIKLALTHNVEYWGFSKIISIVSFVTGLVLIVPFEFIDSSHKGIRKPKTSKLVISKAINLIVIVILFIFSLALEKFGDYLNFKTRDYYLSQETEYTTGVINGIKRVNLVKVGHADFYDISFNVNGNNYSRGLLVNFAEKDCEYFEKFSNPTSSYKNLNIGRLKGNQVQILYSKRFPSFFRIKE